MAINTGPSYGNYLLFEFTTGTWPSGNMFRYTYSNETVSKIDCKCVTSSSSITISYSTTYSNPNCYRMIPNGALTNPTIRVDQDVLANYYLKCYFPGVLTSTFINTDGVYHIVKTNTLRRWPTLYFTEYTSLVT